jgi:hypothetical protein
MSYDFIKRVFCHQIGRKSSGFKADWSGATDRNECNGRRRFLLGMYVIRYKKRLTRNLIHAVNIFCLQLRTRLVTETQSN